MVFRGKEQCLLFATLWLFILTFDLLYMSVEVLSHLLDRLYNNCRAHCINILPLFCGFLMKISQEKRR